MRSDHQNGDDLVFPAAERRVLDLKAIRGGSILMEKPASDPAGTLSPLWHLRVTTFGRFQIEWVNAATGERTPLPAERMQGQNAGTALGLFKALLTRPDRFAPRSWLLEQFWPESRQRAAEERLNDVVSSLRGLLRPPGCTQMFVHFVHGANGRGAGYRLDAYPQLWCDADAFAWYVTHALLLDWRGQDAALLWERAYALAARGEYLPEQIEDEWSRQQREYLSGLWRDCVHCWTQLLWQRGCGEEAIVRLRGYWLAHPTDEDALRPLLEMLGERERFTEAEHVYARAHAALAEDGCEPDTRTVETMEAVRAMQVQRLRGPLTARTVPPRSSSAHCSNGVLWPSDEASLSLLLPFPTEPQYDRIQMIKKGEETAPLTFDPSKRKTLQDIAALAAAGALPTSFSPSAFNQRESFSLEKPPSLANAILEHGEQVIPLSRRLGKGKRHEMILARTLSATCLPLLTALAQQSAPQQKHAANLAAQCARLHAILTYHTQSLVAAEAYAKQAVFYSQIAETPDLLVTAFTFFAQVLYYEGSPEQALDQCLEAEQILDQTTDAVQSYLYRIKAACLAQLGQEKEALTMLHLAQEAFYRHPASAIPFPYAAHDEFELVLWEGITRSHLDQLDAAEASWERVPFHTPSPDLPERVRTGFLNNRVFAELRRPGPQRDLERCLALWQEALTAALELQSELRYQEIVRAYHDLCIAFPGERRIKDARHHLRKWS
jgi:DNA-binding SARP family transcriptional activator